MARNLRIPTQVPAVRLSKPIPVAAQLPAESRAFTLDVSPMYLVWCSLLSRLSIFTLNLKSTRVPRFLVAHFESSLKVTPSLFSSISLCIRRSLRQYVSLFPCLRGISHRCLRSNDGYLHRQLHGYRLHSIQRYERIPVRPGHVEPTQHQSCLANSEFDLGHYLDL